MIDLEMDDYFACWVCCSTFGTIIVCLGALLRIFGGLEFAFGALKREGQTDAMGASGKIALHASQSCCEEASNFTSI